MNAVFNMDQLAAQSSQKIISRTKKENKSIDTLNRLVTKTLGVLQEQGVYAMMLFLLSRTSEEAEISILIRNEFIIMLKNLPEFSKETITDKNNTDKILEFYSSDDVTGDIDTLFLLRDLYEQTMIYTRFGAKAMRKTDEMEAISDHFQS